MKKLIAALFLVCPFLTSGQALRDINYRYLYDPNDAIRFNIKPVRQIDSWKILYSLEIRQQSHDAKDYIIEWQGRENLNAKEGKVLNAHMVDEKTETANGIKGALSISLNDAPNFIVAKIINGPAKTAYVFFTTLDPKYPVNSHLNVNNEPYAKNYLITGKQVSLEDSLGQWSVSYYNDIFPAATPAFSEGQSKVSKSMIADSVFNLHQNQPFTLFANGLFFFQKDTMENTGLAIRAEDDYPKITKSKNLYPPLKYICTKNEFDKLEASKGEKKVFDKTILAITADRERAKKLIKSYYRRVEAANELFTSYKEGWKTDRGMAYIIFGIPDEVFKTNEKEVWRYDDPSFDLTLNFEKASTVFDPDNYVLIRDKKYQEVWYEVVDLWRNARF